MFRYSSNQNRRFTLLDSVVRWSIIYFKYRSKYRPPVYGSDFSAPINILFLSSFFKASLNRMVLNVQEMYRFSWVTVFIALSKLYHRVWSKGDSMIWDFMGRRPLTKVMWIKEGPYMWNKMSKNCRVHVW